MQTFRKTLHWYTSTGPLTHTEQVVSPSLKQRLSHCWLSILNLYPHRRLPLPVYAGVFQRSNFSFNPQICIFLSSRISQLPKLKPFSFSVRAMPALPSGGSRIFRQGRPGCRSIFLLFLLLLHRGRGAATPAGTPRGDPGDTLRVPLPTVPHKRGSDQSTRGLNALQQNYIWFQPIRKPNNRMQSTKKQHVSVHTHAPLPPSRPAAFNRLTAPFSALRVMILKLALQVLLNLLFQPFPGSRAQLLPLSPNLWVPDLFLVATGIPLHRQNLTQHEWTCFSHSVQIPLVRDAASQAEIHSMERRSAWQEKDSGPAEMAPSCGVTHTIPQNTFLYLLQPSGHSPPWGEGN